jgi:quercetin dioxygenase-like cupin family protein
MATGLPVMSDGRVTHHRWEEIPKEVLNPQLARRVISGERVMLARVYLERGAIVPQHAHENEQLTYLLEGSMRFWFGEDGAEVIDLGAGEVLHIPSNVVHRAQALEKSLDVDIFCPPRADWLDGSDAYLRSTPPATDA